MVRLPRNEKQTYRLNSKASNGTIRFDLGHDLDLQFSRSNLEFPLSQPKMVRLPRNEKQTYELNSRPQMGPSDLTLPMTLTFNFQGQIWNFLYPSQKWSDCHETKMIVTGVTSVVGVPSTHLVESVMTTIHLAITTSHCRIHVYKH